MSNQSNGQSATLAGFIWKIADDLWGDFKYTDFGKVILPFTLFVASNACWSLAIRPQGRLDIVAYMGG